MSIFSCVCWPYWCTLCLLFFSLFFNWTFVCVCDEVDYILYTFWVLLLIWYMVWKSCLTFCKLSFHLVNCWFCYTETSDFDVVTFFIFVFIVCPFGVILLKKSLPRHCFFPMFSSRSFMVSSILSLLSYLLCVTWDSIISLFCMYFSSFPAPLVEETTLSPFHILSSLVKY